MPKEITHWTLAEMARKRIEETGLGKSLTAHQRLYLLGAVIYDTPFYAPETDGGKAVMAQGKMVHGTPANNTMLPLARLAKRYDRKGDAALLALIAGAATHLMADITFHPFVEYFARDSIPRHYRLEALLDCHFFQKGVLQTPPRVSDHLAAIGEKKEELLHWMALFFDLPPTLAAPLKATLQRHSTIQGLFEKRWAGLLVSLLAAVYPKKFTQIKCLFYPPGIQCHAPFFNGRFTFRHPVTGETYDSSIETLTQTALQRIGDLFSRIEEAGAQGKLEALFLSMPALSLETGMDPSLPGKHTWCDTRLTIDELILGAK